MNVVSLISEGVFFFKSCEGVLKNVVKFTGKHLCQNNFIKKEALTQVFSCEFCEIFKTSLQLYFKKSSGRGVSLWILRNF